MDFSLHTSLQILERTPRVLRSLLAGLSDEWTHNNEGGESWSPYDVVGHLIHGEKTDWIPRMRCILGKDENKHFIPFNRTAQFEESKGKSLEELLSEFEHLRAANIAEVQNCALSDDDLEQTGIHPHFGTVTLRQLLATWTAHDLGHLVQIARVMARQYSHAVGPWKEYLSVLHKA